MILYLARHGETDLNIDDRYQGSSNLPLNARGLQQAASLATRVPAGVVAVVSSPQLRAYQTAQAVAATTALALETQVWLRERDFGVFEGLSQAEVQHRYPQLWVQNVVQQWNGAPPGGETVNQVVQLVADGLQALRAQYKEQAIVLVTHGFVVRAVRFLLSGIPQDEFFALPKIGNGEFLTFVLP
jgi:broad specificity phosphatase PhoE